MSHLTLQDRLPRPTGLTGTITALEDTQRHRFEMIAQKICAPLSCTKNEIEFDIFNRFCERLLPITFCDWMKKS